MNKTLETVLSPCKRSNLGGIAILLILVSASIWLLYSVGCLLCKGIKFLYSKHKETEKKKGVQIRRDNIVREQLSTFGKLEYCLHQNLNVLYYTVKRCTNSKVSITYYVDFYLPDGDNLWNVNKEISEYLLRDMFVMNVCATGKNKGRCVLRGIDELKLVQSLSKLYGTPVRLMKLEEDEL